MFYRRKIILALLESFCGKIPNTDFQKYLFLFTRLQENPSFDFVPYRFGAFSFQSYADKRTMTRYGLIYSSSDNWEKRTSENYVSQLNEMDKRLLKNFMTQFRKMHGRELLRYVYKNYPYYAIHSEITERIFTTDEQAAIQKQVSLSQSPGLFTIGYEGLSIEKYLNNLIIHNIRALCDVRRNALSMKYGFSKNQLREMLQKMNIIYVHLPELGIESKMRRNLDSAEDYQELFRQYEHNTLPQHTAALERLKQLIAEHSRIALTCFEASPSSCHRHKICNALQRTRGWKYPVKHIQGITCIPKS